MSAPEPAGQAGELLDGLRRETPARIARAQQLLAEQGLDALVAYGNNKITGSLYYLTGFYPDRAGWVSLAADRTQLIEGAVVVVPASGEPVLIVDIGLTLSRAPTIANVQLGGFSAAEGGGLTGAAIAGACGLGGGTARIGIETWDRFPAPLAAELGAALPGAEIVQSRIVEEMRLVKSEAEIAVLRSAGRVADRGHEAVVARLAAGPVSELELIRTAEDVMRRANPIYEDGCSNSPSMIASGSSVCDVPIHAPQADKLVGTGDIVHWDICMRHLGYGIDTARTRCVGEPAPEQARAYEALLELYDEVVGAAVPGRTSQDLVRLAQAAACARGYALWGSFLGHGVGIDVHERPDMGVEDLPLEAGMVLALEPRFALDGGFLIGNEDLVVVREGGGERLMDFPKLPFSVSPEA